MSAYTVSIIIVVIFLYKRKQAIILFSFKNVPHWRSIISVFPQSISIRKLRFFSQNTDNAVGSLTLDIIENHC